MPISDREAARRSRDPQRPRETVQRGEQDVAGRRRCWGAHRHRCFALEQRGLANGVTKHQDMPLHLQGSAKSTIGDDSDAKLRAGAEDAWAREAGTEDAWAAVTLTGDAGANLTEAGDAIPIGTLTGDACALVARSDADDGMKTIAGRRDSC